MLPYIKNEYWKLYTDFLHISLCSIKHGYVWERERERERESNLQKVPEKKRCRSLLSLAISFATH
jgi:hypothetical protein